MSKASNQTQPEPRTRLVTSAWAGDQAFRLSLIALLILSLAPLLIMLNISLKSFDQYEYHRWHVGPPFEWNNYREAWTIVRLYVGNSILTSGVAAFGVVFLSAAGGYAFARRAFPLREPLFMLFLSGMMIPGILLLVPKFVTYKELGLINTRWALYLSYWTEGQIFGIYLFRNYFESLPSGLFQSAELDGANAWQVFRHIAVPLSKPIAGTLVVLTVLGTWNDIVWPWLVISENRLRTISIGLSVFRSAFKDNAGPIFAGYVIASVPLVIMFVFASRQIVQGLTSGAFKA